MDCFMGIGQWFSGHGIFSVLLNIIIITALVGITIKLFRIGGSPPAANQDAADTINILEQRLAKGDISEEEYLRIRDILGR
jgi:putative membrane protein